jgi:hypothetical protein
MSSRSRSRQRSKTGFSSTSSGDSGTSGASGSSDASQPSGAALSPAVSTPVPPVDAAAASRAVDPSAKQSGESDGKAGQDGQGKEETDDMRKKRIHAIMGGNPQIIPLHVTDAWNLLDVLEHHFEPNEFRTEVRATAIWLSCGGLEHTNFVDRCAHRDIKSGRHGRFALTNCSHFGNPNRDMTRSSSRLFGREMAEWRRLVGTIGRLTAGRIGVWRTMDCKSLSFEL